MSNDNRTTTESNTARTLTLRKETVRGAQVRSGVKAGARSTTLRCGNPGTVVYTTCGTGC